MTEEQTPTDAPAEDTATEDTTTEDTATTHTDTDGDTVTDEQVREAEEKAPSAVTSAVVDVTGTDAADTGEYVEGNPHHV